MVRTGNNAICSDITYIVLVDLLGKVKLGHAILVDFDNRWRSLGVKFVSAKGKHGLFGIQDIGVRRQFHARVAFLGGTHSSRVKSRTLSPSRLAWAAGGSGRGCNAARRIARHSRCLRRRPPGCGPYIGHATAVRHFLSSISIVLKV